MRNRRYLLDSSAWISYFIGDDPVVRELIEGNDENAIYCSVLSFYEISKIISKKGIGKEQAAFFLDVVRRRSIVIELTEGSCIKAAASSLALGLYAIDALIYQSALEQQATLVTGDADFRKRKINNVIILQ
jgi:predicted nucleic acid-binding protein